MENAKKTPKQAWERPQLIALTRSRPEEAVLATCKLTSSGTGVGATTTVSQCRQSTWRSTSCTANACSSRTGS